MQTLRVMTAVVALTAAAMTQSPLTTMFAANSGGADGGALYFDLTVAAPLTVVGLDLNLSDASSPGSIEIWVLPGQSRVGHQTNQAIWTLADTGTFTTAGRDIPTAVALSHPIPLSATGIVGCAIVVHGAGHAYTYGNGGNQNHATAELALAAGEASNVAFAGALFTPRVVNCSIHYVLGTGSAVATAVGYGRGGGSFASTYESFASPATFDLGGANLQFSERAGGGWDVAAGPGPVPHTAATPLPLLDDTEVTQALASGFAPSVNVCSNGFLSVGGSNGVGFTPDANIMLNNPFEAWYVWHDFNPGAPGSGQVEYEFLGGEDVFTWDGVYEFGSVVPSTFQIRLSGTPGSRIVRCCFVSVAGSRSGLLVGYSPAGSSLDPDGTDISATPTQTLVGADVPRMTLTGNPRPIVGTSAGLDTTDIPVGALGAFQLLSPVQNAAGFDLGALGAPGNTFYLGSIDVALSLAITGTGATLALPIPNSSALLGAHAFAQTLAIVPTANRLGLVTSNGLDLSIGDL